MTFIQTLLKYENLLDQKVQKYVWNHPVQGFLFLFFLAPLLILAGICLLTALIALITTSLFGFI